MLWTKYLLGVFQANGSDALHGRLQSMHNADSIQDSKSALQNLYFPLTTGRMYGGALMANSVFYCLQEAEKQQKRFELINFKTCFFNPTTDKSHGTTNLLKAGQNFRWGEYLYINPGNNNESSKLTARTTVLIDSAKTFSGLSENDPDLMESPVLHDRINATHQGESFNSYMLNFFQSIDEHFFENLEFYKKSNGFLDFIEFISTLFNLRIENESPLEISYSISQDCPEEEITSIIIYMIDILMICFTAIPTKQPIHDRRLLIFSSVEHEMKFVKNIPNKMKRSGLIISSLLSCPKENPFYFVAANIISSDGHLFCHATQIVNLSNLKYRTSKL